MPRPPAPLLWLATLASGVALGLALGQRGQTLSAQTPTQGGAPAAAASAPARTDDPYRELARTYERFQGVDRAFEAVARVVAPSVVHITAKKIGTREDGDVGRVEESGSGVIVRPDGAKGLYVLTNNHVVDRAEASEISILLHDGQVLRPSRFWADPKADVAVLKLDRDDLPCARLGDSDDARVGTWVVALGSPFGLMHSVSQGIISARGRYEAELEFDGVEHQEFLQTDAAINPGNSGGPLVNLKGEVIGLNTAIASEGGGSEGVGFSIPINLAKWAMAQLVAGGSVHRGAMGVNLQELSPQAAAELGLSRPRGARIVSVHPASPAAEAGLKPDDVVLKFNGVEVIDNNHLINLVSISPIGRPSDLVIWRDGKPLPSRVTVADRDAILARVPARAPANAAAARRPGRGVPPAASGSLGLTLSALDDATRVRLFGPDSDFRGVLVREIEPASPLAGTLRVDDALVTIGGVAATTPEDALVALRRPPGAAPIELGIRRREAGVTREIVVRLPE